MKIIATIGPASENHKKFNSIFRYADIIRLNGSHNNLTWHKKIIDQIKRLNPNATILFDIPGVKPRTLNSEIIAIKKNEEVLFYFKNKIKTISTKSIQISNQIPKTKKIEKYFSIDDGKYIFKKISSNNNYIIGKSNSSFLLKPQKGLNIIGGIYDDRKQSIKYINFINKIKSFNINAIGLSYIQNPDIIKNIRNKFKNFLIISKIENYQGLKNVNNICIKSDAVMIDRGDLAAEIGLENMYEAISTITQTAKKNYVPVIMATENFTSMLNNNQPSKSDLISIEHAKSLGTDCIMLSEETATNKNYLRTLSWLYKSIGNKIEKKFFSEEISVVDVDHYLKSMQLLVVSKKGYIFEKTIKRFSNTYPIYMTNDKFSYYKSTFYKNYKSVFVNNLSRGKFDLHYLYNLIKHYKKLIFKNHNKAILIHAVFPKKFSRANSLTIIDKKDF